MASSSSPLVRFQDHALLTKILGTYLMRDPDIQKICHLATKLLHGKTLNKSQAQACLAGLNSLSGIVSKELISSVYYLIIYTIFDKPSEENMSDKEWVEKVYNPHVLDPSHRLTPAFFSDHGDYKQ